MIEVVVAIFIFAILVVGMTVTMGSSLNLVRNDRNRSVAANLAAQEMDTVRSTDFERLPIGQSVTTQDVGAVTYRITRESEWVTKSASAGACDAPSGSRPAYVRVNVAVTWPSMRGVQPVQSNTIITPPVGAYDPVTGHIGVKVLDRDGQPESMILVTIAGPTSQSQQTNSDGCAFFAFIPEGAYTVTASATGYVDLQGVSAPTQPAGVVVGAITSISFQYDQAATLSIALLGKDTGSPAPGSDMGLYLHNTHLTPETMSVVGAGSPRTISGLFPYADGYEAWVGDCADADPAYYAGGSRASVAAEPGATTTANIPLPEVRVIVETDPGDGSMVPVPGQQVDAAHGTGCTQTFLIGQTDVNGELAFALPWGTWEIWVGGVLIETVALDPTIPPADGDGAWPWDLAVIQ
jgi:type II secretory pathway pseudopilin PulG